jgi:predicted TPR repeat methyltransferase
MQIEVLTDNPIAVDSLDHLHPLGTAKDNTPDCGFIDDIKAYFEHSPISLLDLGCAGGQFVVDAHNAGLIAVGLEGSDYSLHHGRANWPLYAGKNLFTCDLRYPFRILSDGEPLRFDCITAWDVLEHFTENELEQVFDNVKAHLSDGGIFCGKVYLGSAGVIDGVDHHRTQHEADWWCNKLKEHFDVVTPCPITHFLRADHLLYCLKKKQL